MFMDSVKQIEIYNIDPITTSGEIKNGINELHLYFRSLNWIDLDFLSAPDPINSDLTTENFRQVLQIPCINNISNLSK